jgi:uncharacterized membrane protein YeaQ/YmgE (transglycosylase-associated protein family)
MNWLLRILLAVIVGVLVTAVLEWLTPVPHNIDVLLGIVAALITYFGYDGHFNGHVTP